MVNKASVFISQPRTSNTISTRTRLKPCLTRVTVLVFHFFTVVIITVKPCFTRVTKIFQKILKFGQKVCVNNSFPWKRISHKQSARRQHLSWLKASAFFSLQKKFVSCMKYSNLYSGIVTPSSGWWSPIAKYSLVFIEKKI